MRQDVASVAASPKLPIVLVMDNVRSALNVGSAFRTSDAFAVRQIILCGISAVPPHREIAKTALGATETVNWQYFQDAPTAIAHLKQQDWMANADGAIEIPQFGAKHSLNVSVCVGVVVWEIVSKLTLQ